jgi:hypothetical protein
MGMHTCGPPPQAYPAPSRWPARGVSFEAFLSGRLQLGVDGTRLRANSGARERHVKACEKAG